MYHCVHNRREDRVLYAPVYSALSVCGESYAWNANHVRLFVYDVSILYVFGNVCQMTLRICLTQRIDSFDTLFSV